MGRIFPLDLVGGRGREYASQMAGQKKVEPSAKTSLVKHHRKFRILTIVI